MGTFDIDAYVEALEKPSVKIDDVVYEGRILSIVEWMPFEKRFKDIEVNGESFITLSKEYLYKVFPKPVLKWKTDIVPKILESPALMDLMKDFLVLQATAILPNEIKKKMNGTLPPENL